MPLEKAIELVFLALKKITMEVFLFIKRNQ